MIGLAGSGDGDILNVMPFFKASLEADAIAGRHRRLWSDSSGTSITSIEVETPFVCSNHCTLGESLSRQASFCTGCYLRALQEVRAVGSCVR
jgi:hypothetical protein